MLFQQILLLKYCMFCINDFVSLSKTFAEKGQFLALDLGGSKFKVLQVKVREDAGVTKGEVQMKEKIYPIPKGLLSGKGTEVGRQTGGKTCG